MKKYLYCLLILLLSGWNLVGFSQKENLDLESARKQIREIHKEIQQLQKQLAETQTSLQSELGFLENLDKQINLVKKAVRLIQNSLHRTDRRIKILQNKIDSLDTEIRGLKELFKKQIVFAYKYQRGKELVWLLGAQNFNQALIRYQYFKKFSHWERNLYEQIVQKQQEYIQLEKALEKQKREKTLLLADRRQEEERLRSTRADRQNRIQKIQNNQKLLTRALEEKKRNYQHLQQLIAQLEKERNTRQLTPEIQTRWERISGNFARQRGQLNWPVSGKILHPFGRYKNPRLKTVLYNSGIDIKAPKGSPVRCVFPGVISLITYMSGFGNTVIIDHNNGFYSVYTHLEDIYVKKFDFIEAGEIIGTVGDSGSLEGALLHFEIYGGNKPLNPLTWLKRR